MALACVACGPPAAPRDAQIPEADAAVRDATPSLDAYAQPDTDCPPPETCPRYRCTPEGALLEAVWVGPPPPRCGGHCEYGPVSLDPCGRGCVPFGYAYGEEQLDELCVLAHPGDACDGDAACAPAAPDPGFGDGATRPTLHCDLTRGACAADEEACDGVDDDLDTRIDEGCACAPVLVAAGATDVVLREVAFTPSSVVWAQEAGVETTLVRVDGTGAHAAARTMAGTWSLATGARTESPVAWSRAPVMLFWLDDTLQTLAIGTPTALGPALAARWGDDVLLLSRDLGWSALRVDRTGVVVTSEPISAGDAAWAVAPLSGGGLALVGSTTGQILLADASLTITPGATVAPLASLDVATTSARIWLFGQTATGLALVSLDRSTGAPIGSPVLLGTLPVTMAPRVVGLAAQGDHLVVAWVGADASARARVFAEDGTELGRSLHREFSDPSTTPVVFAGATDAQALLVSQRGAIVAPCPGL